MSPGKYDRKIKTQRNRREFAQAVDHVVQFDTERETSPGLEIQMQASRNGGPLRGFWTGAARLSSARHVNGFLKWINERNPYRLLYLSGETARVSERKVRMTSSQRGPLMPWATHMIQWMLQWVAKPQGGANPIKSILSSDRRLKLASLKLESLVIANHNVAVNTFSNFALTARQSKGAGNT